MRTLSAILFCSVLLVPSSVARAVTVVGGMIASDTHWVADTYRVSQSILIVNDATLTIDPGAEIRFDPDMRLEVARGTLVARGLSSNPIRFTANATGPIGDNDRWDCIRFSDEAADATFDGNKDYLAGSILEYSVVEWAGGLGTHAVDLQIARPYIASNSIHHNGAGGINLDYAPSVRLIGNTITDNTGLAGSAIRIHYSNGVQIEGSILSDNTSVNDQGALYTYTADDLIVRDSVITNNVGMGVYIGDEDSNLVLSADSATPTAVHSNGPYNIYNNATFQDVFYPSGLGNMDARNVWWGTTSGPDIAAGIYDYIDNPNMGIVFYAPFMIPGDTDANVKVDIVDLTALGANWSTLSPGDKNWSQGDFNYDRTVDIVDLTALAANWSFIGDPPPVPEPATLSLLALGGLAIMRRKRRG